MKAKMMIGVLVGMVVAASAMASEPAVIDTGKGGLHAVLSLPEMAGPYDFAKNKGVSVSIDPRLSGGAAAFLGGEGSFDIVDKLMTMDRKQSKPSDQPITAEHLANEMLKTNGFTIDRAIKFDGPMVNIPGATVATYKASGSAVYEQEKNAERRFMIVQAVSFPGQTKGYAIMATIKEKNVAAFDADPAKYESLAKRAFIPLFKGLTISEN